MYCVYNETLITSYNVHHRQFKESINGDRYPMFPGGQADIVIDDAGNYRVLTTQTEVLFIGTGKAAVSTETTTTTADARGNTITTGNDPKLAGFNEALARVKYAQPSADITVYHNGRKYTADEYADKLDTADQDPPFNPFP